MNVDQLWTRVKHSLVEKNSVTSDVYNRYVDSAKLIESNNPQTFFLVVKYDVAKAILSDFVPKIREIINEETKKTNQILLLNEEEYLKQKPIVKNNKNFDLSFDKFIVGPSNKQAYMASKTICKNIGKVFNPLFIYANSGLGKTHLLKAIGHEVDLKNPSLNVLYLTTEKFGNEAVEVLQNGKYEEIENFKSKIKVYDVLLIDDVQFLAKKEKTNELFFSIFNDFVENNKQIVITSDKSPEELNGFDQRMITRFNSGLSVKIDIPDQDTAISIIKKEIDNPEEHLNLTSDAIDYLATYFSSDVRKIKGSINRLILIQMTRDSDIFTLEDIMEEFKGIPSSSLGGRLNTTKIKEVVGEKYGVSVRLIDGKTRTADVIMARHVAMYLTKDILHKPLTQIGVDFGGKDHTTVMNAINKVEKRLQKDKEFNKTLAKMKNSIMEK